MSEQATLSADTLAPASNLEKDLAVAQRKMADSERTAEQGYALKDKGLQGEAQEIGRERAETKQFAVDHPFPHPDIKPWTAKPPEPDPVKAFGSWASAFGILAGAITKTGLASSLNASAAAINAYRKNDIDAYQEAKEAWKDNTEIAIENAEWEAKGYQSAFDLMQSDHAAGLAQAQVVASQADNKIALSLLKSNNLKGLWDMQLGLANYAAGGPERMLRLQEVSTKIEDQMARKDLLKKWTEQNPKATPLEASQARTQIMNPQYTINQAKVLAENGPGGGGQGLDPEAVDYWATRVRAGEPMPPLGIGKQAALMRRQIANRAADMAKESGSTAQQDMVKRATLNAEKTSLNKLVPQKNAIHAFEQTAIKNGAVLLQLVDKVDSTGIPVIERWIRAGRRNIEGDPDVTAFNTQMGVFAPEVAKILNNPNLTGVLTDTQIAEAKSLMPDNITAQQLKTVLPLLTADFARRTQAIDDEIETVQGTIAQLGSKGGGADVTGSGGGTDFKTEDDARAAEKAGKIKIGDKITINGKKVKVSD